MAIAMIKESSTLGIVYTFKESKSIFYVGYILTKDQIQTLKKFHNIVISEAMYNALGERKILNEIKRLTGIECIIKVHEHNNEDELIKIDKSYIVWRKPLYVLNTQMDVKNYVLIIENYDNKIERKFDKKLTLDEVKKIIRELGYNGVKIK